MRPPPIKRHTDTHISDPNGFIEIINTTDGEQKVSHIPYRTTQQQKVNHQETHPSQQDGSLNHDSQHPLAGFGSPSVGNNTAGEEIENVD